MSRVFNAWQDGEPQVEKDYNIAAAPASMEKYYLNWGEIQDLVETLYSKLPFKPKAIIAISRGGLIPGVMLSHLTGCRKMYEMRCEQYDDITHLRKPLHIEMGHEAHVAMLNADTVVIEDIVDTGATMTVIEAKFPNPLKMALVRKHEAKDNNITRIALVVPQTTWVEFPWELSNDRT